MIVAFLKRGKLTVEITNLMREAKTCFGKSHIPFNVLFRGERRKVNLGHDTDSLPDRRLQLIRDGTDSGRKRHRNEVG